ncbi:NAD(P)H-dependent oxidoreductase [Ahrensia kielensis]|uniref:NAD(P)H-dependent oxidoreductase n=1 Tax=Ahrensia kielensis TaxID=76980 RepID=A0ABU9T632_9HYPH
MKAIVFLGSVRESTPPHPARLGARVAAACASQLAKSDINVEVIDPLDLDLPAVFKPHFSFGAGRAPEALESLSIKIKDADCFVMVSPEYNHSMSPALANMLNHFGSSSFSFKPSAIVTYSAGQWGGARAAVSMRTYLSELGCLPVSAMIHIPHAQDVFDEDGSYANGVDPEKWESYMGRTLNQLVWWSEAAAQQRIIGNPTAAFDRNPTQRNAP